MVAEYVCAVNLFFNGRVVQQKPTWQLEVIIFIFFHIFIFSISVFEITKNENGINARDRVNRIQSEGKQE